MNSKYAKLTLLVMALFVVGAILAPGLFAEGEAYEANSQSLGEKILGIGSGPIGISTQLMCIFTSIFLTGWTIECFINVRRDKIVPPEVMGALQNYIDEGDLEGALQYCESAPNYLTRIIGAGLNRMQYGGGSVKEAAGNTSNVEQGKLEFHISPIALAASLGPMMGLFGTVVGMVMAFEQIENAPGGQVNPKMVAGSIALALLSTVIGLIIAMPGIASFWYFKNKVANIGTAINLVADEMIEAIAAYADQQK
jgi:biopolymer transport protein ExbB